MYLLLSVLCFFLHQSAKREVPTHIPRPEYAESGVAESERLAKRSSLIKQLNADEIEGMRKACRVRTGPD